MRRRYTQDAYMPGQLDRSYVTHDGLTVDSTGAFLQGELVRLDQLLHMPLVDITWTRDIDLREDVSIADEASSFTQSQVAASGGLGGSNAVNGGKAWAGKVTSQIQNVSVDIGLVATPLNLWMSELKYTIPELESAIKLGRPVDQQKFEALNLKHQMDIDAQVYVGDADTGAAGLCNNTAQVTPVNVLAGGAGTTQWATKTADEILADINTAISLTWAASGWKVMPTKLLLPPAQFAMLVARKVSDAGNVSIMKFVKENNIATQSGLQFEIVHVKWLIGAGVGGTLGTLGTVDRMVLYTQQKDRVRYPMTPLQKTPIQYDSIYQKATYYCRLGAVEFVYPETVGYYDGV